MKISGKKILLTGSTGTIGSALARELLKSGNHLVLHYFRSREKAKSAMDEFSKSGLRINTLSADLSQAKNATKLVRNAAEILGGLNILIDTSSTCKRIAFADITESDWSEAIDTNLKSTLFLTQAAADVMKSSGGRIILFSDVAAKNPYAKYLPYCISKAGIDALIKGLPKVLPKNMLVNGIAPYIVSRPDDMIDEDWEKLMKKMPKNRPPDVRRIFDLVDELCSDDFSTTGQIFELK